MTIEQLQKYLIQNSPFKFKGVSKELFSFEKDSYSINDGEKYRYKLSKEGDNFIFEDGGIFPVFQNVRIEVINKKDFTVTLNFNAQSLKNNPYRNKDSENGYFILQPFKQSSK